MTDAERANDIRARLRQALVPAITLLRECNENGFSVSFQVGGDPVDVVKIDVSKVTKL